MKIKWYILFIIFIFILLVPNKKYNFQSTKVIFTVFAGRENYMNILTRYIDKLIDMGQIDEVHLWDFTRTDSDGEYIKKLGNEKERYKVMTVKNKKNWSEYYNHYKDIQYTDDVIIKCDDDIVFIDVDKFKDFINERLKNDCFLLFPSILNNGWGAYFQGQEGILPSEVFKVNENHNSYALGVPDIVEHGDNGKKIHTYFVENKQDFIEKSRQNNNVFEVNFEERISINFVAILGRDFNSLPDSLGDDEHEITVVYPPKIGRKNKFYMGLVVVHGTFSPQRDKLTDKFVQDLYNF